MKFFRSRNLPSAPGGEAVASPSPFSRATLRVWWPLLAAVGAVVLGFSLPLYELTVLATNNSLYSHVLLIPVASVVFAWLNGIPIRAAPPRATLLAGGLAAAAATLLLVNVGLNSAGVVLSRTDHLALTTGSFLAFCLAACAWFFDRATLRRLAFPLAFLLFMVPFPTAVERGIEFLLQHGSAWVAYFFFKLYGTPIFAHDLIFELPGFRLEVAPECSGIRSSLVLFIISLAASWLFLKTPWKRTLLVLAVIPLGLLRNGLRVFVIGQLCVDVGPHMIDSYIHRGGGGPIFFGLSLVPLTLLLFILWRSERMSSRPPNKTLNA